ncbi:MAG TPA: four helix bundle protein [Vicinamibacterales bacterium]|nr:four helix bundle protein [Vicinamibacterales bacterium]HOG28622.1 four helix bundle protein [Vicinamibacterales bacterium]HOQ61159.1 four helix bundle protein [Vicinamibacterales bacterium]HPK71972.1 four helix bundle protein [Vicinamibacterales bacterium]HPW19671.1 four helix bundle protein [Vicinamibacterales bacterium]
MKEKVGAEAKAGGDRAPARSFRDLIVWQKAHELVLATYRVSASFPKTESFGLTAQIRSAAVSIAANIAEGFRRSGRSDKARMLNVAQGSLEEVRYYLILARDLQYGGNAEIDGLLEDVSRLLNAYRRKLLTPLP